MAISIKNKYILKKLLYRLLLKQSASFTKEQFVVKQTPEILRLGFDDQKNWTDSQNNSGEEISTNLDALPSFFHSFETLETH